MEECCFICMQNFNEEYPSYMLPCLNRRCNSFVHAKCIYEWNARQNERGTCPLCRSSLGYIDYDIDDMINSKHFDKYSYRKDFINRPVPKDIGMIKCYFKEYADRYEFWVQAPTIFNYPQGNLPQVDPIKGDKLIMIAKVRDTLKGFVTKITLDLKGKDFNKKGFNYCGIINSSLSGLKHTILQPYRDITSNPNLSSEVAFVKYTHNRFYKKSPRKMIIIIPPVELEDEYNKLMKNKIPIWKTKTCSKKKEKLSKYETNNNNGKVLILKNKEPIWNRTAYSLDFFGRAELSSNSNFQILNDGEICLQFGKIKRYINPTTINIPIKMFTIDLKWPLSPLQAFGICITARMYKFGTI